MSDSGDDLDARIDADVRADRRAYRRLAAIGAVVAVVITLAVALWLAVAPERNDPPPPPAARSSGRESPLVDLSDAITLRPDDDADPTRFTVPAAVGAVERIALVRCDLGETLWEVTAEPARSGRVTFVVGTEPEGFSNAVPLRGSARRGLLVVNGSAHLGLRFAGCR